MKNQQIIIARIVEHLSQISQEVQSQFPLGSFILDKKLTGCGATFMVLADSIPTILCSPRIELIRSKADNPYFKGFVHLFRDPDDRTTPVMDLELRLKDYVENTPLINPYNNRAQKIITTYDSFKHVAQKLYDLGRLYKYRIVVDEAQTLMTDSGFKGDVEMEFLHNVSHLSNQVIYLSATPGIERYLDQMPEFQNLPYVELIWPKECYHTANIVKMPYYRNSVKTTASRVIQKYFSRGYFEEKIWKGRRVQAHEAVLYLNDVGLIIKLIEENGLTPDNTNIICAAEDDNYKRLGEITDAHKNRLGFTIGHAPQEGLPHKPITLATKSSFEGADFYSPCAYTYIFSDINLKHLGLDISLDVPQIMGRQRLKENPFRYDATFFYKTISDLKGMEYPEFREKIAEKCENTNNWINTYNGGSPSFQNNIADKLRRLQKTDNCSKDYATVVEDTTTGKREVVLNHLAMFNEIRAWEIQKSQYLDKCQVMSSVDDTTYTPADDPLLKSFIQQFDGDFEYQMKMYCDFLAAHPEYKEALEGLPQIPMIIKEYYNDLGPEAIRASSYVQTRIDRKTQGMPCEDDLKKEVLAAFIVGSFYSYKQIKSTLEEIYERLGIDRAPKATALEEWLECKQTKGIVDEKKENGYKIIGVKDL